MMYTIVDCENSYLKRCVQSVIEFLEPSHLQQKRLDDVICKGRLLGLLINIRLDWKSLLGGTKSLYYRTQRTYKVS